MRRIAHKRSNRRFIGGLWHGTAAFSKKVENHAYAVALHMMYYSFVRLHQSLRVTPAMAAGVSDRLWEIGDIVALIEKAESRIPTKRGPYKKRTA
jgi:hypothetical protein